MAEPLRDDLTLWRGRDFGPYGWPLTDEHGQPLRSKAGVTATAELAATATAPRFEFDVEVLERTVADDPEPTVFVLLSLTAARTRDLPFVTGIYDVLIDRADEDNPPGVCGRIWVRDTVSREPTASAP